MHRLRSAQWKIEALLAGAFAAAASHRVLPPWMEALGFDPDHGDGSAEWLVVMILGVAAAVTAAVARYQYLRRMPAQQGGPS